VGTAKIQAFWDKYPEISQLSLEFLHQITYTTKRKNMGTNSNCTHRSITVA